MRLLRLLLTPQGKALLEDLDPSCRRVSSKLVVDYSKDAILPSDDLLVVHVVCSDGALWSWRLARNLAIAVSKSVNGQAGCCGSRNGSASPVSHVQKLEGKECTVGRQINCSGEVPQEVSALRLLYLCNAERIGCAGKQRRLVAPTQVQTFRRFTQALVLPFCEEPSQQVRRYRFIPPPCSFSEPNHRRSLQGYRQTRRLSVPLFTRHKQEWWTTVMHQLCSRFTTLSAEAESEASLLFITTLRRKQPAFPPSLRVRVLGPQSSLARPLWKSRWQTHQVDFVPSPISP